MSKDLYSAINEVLATNSAGSSTSGLSSISGLNTSGGLDNTGVDGTVYKTPKVTGAKKRFGFGWELTPEIETTVKQVLSDKGIEADENDPQGLYKAYNTARLNDRIQASTELARKFGIAWDGRSTISDIKDVLRTMDKQTHAYHDYVDSYADRIAKINSDVVKNIWQNPDKFNNDNASNYFSWDIKDTGEHGTQKNIPPGIDPDTGRPETSPKPDDGPIDPQDLDPNWPHGPIVNPVKPEKGPDQGPPGDETPGEPGSPWGLDPQGMPELGHDTGDIIPPWEVDPRPEKWPKRPGFDPNNPYPPQYDPNDPRPQLQPIPWDPNNPQTVPPLYPEPKPQYPDHHPLSPNYKPYTPPMIIPPIGPGIIPNLLRPLVPALRRLIPALAKTEQVEYNIQERFRYNTRTGILSSANRS